MIATIGQMIVWVFLFILISQLIIRLIRHYYKFPIPGFMVDMIDNPLRRKIQPPCEMPVQFGIEPGMIVLEVDLVMVSTRWKQPGESELLEK